MEDMEDGELAYITLKVTSDGKASTTFDFAEILTSEQVVGIAAVLSEMSNDCLEFLTQVKPITQH